MNNPNGYQQGCFFDAAEKAHRTGIPITPVPESHGLTILEDADAPRRIGEQLLAVYDVMKDGEWHTLAELAAVAKCKEQSASARVRDLRKKPYSLTVERRLHSPGVFKYRLVPG